MVILDFTDISENIKCLSDCGGKGKNLFLLKKIGFNIPAFIVIPSTVISNELSILEKCISELLLSINKENDFSINQAALEIQNKISLFEFSALFISQVTKKIEYNFGNEFCVSVRSSAIAEDTDKDSFAGQYETCLFVIKERLIQALKQCVSSAFGARVIKYKLLRGISIFELGIAVVVQQMIDSKKSGVVFTRDVTANLNEMLIVAGFGQGEGVVSDLVDTDEYFVDRQTKKVRSNIKTKNSFATSSSNIANGISITTLDSTLSAKAVLHYQQVLELFNMALKIEDYYGFPQDIEFAFDNNDTLFILQSRNITTFNANDIKIIDNSNIVESYPRLTLPLTFTFAQNAYKYVFTGAGRLFHISEKDLFKLDESLSELITHVQGRVYYNLHHWYKIVQTIIVSEESLQAWENLIGLRNNEKRNLKAPFLKKIKTSIILAGLIIRYNLLMKKFFSFFESEYGVIRAYANELNNSKQTPSEIISFFETKSKSLFKGWAPTIVNDFFTFKLFDLLKKMVANYGFKEDENITNCLLCGIEGVESEMPIICLLELKKQINSDVKLILLFKSSPSEIVDKLDNADYLQFKNNFYNYIKNYGDRILEELKLETENLRMNPSILVSMIKNQLHTENNIEQLRSKQLILRTGAEEKIKSKQHFFYPKTWLFKTILRRTRNAVKNRENMRFARARAYGVVKEMFFSIAKIMVDEGIISERKDIYYLSVEEVKFWCLKTDNNTSHFNYKEIISERKIMYDRYLNTVLPDRIMYQGNIIPIPTIFDYNTNEETLLKGIAVSAGIVKAKAMVIDKPNLLKRIDKQILITKMTDPGWIFLMAQASGIISEKGSLLSHTAIVGRELGIPTIVGVSNATRIIKNGALIEMDGEKGEVKIN